MTRKVKNNLKRFSGSETPKPLRTSEACCSHASSAFKLLRAFAIARELCHKRPLTFIMCWPQRAQRSKKIEISIEIENFDREWNFRASHPPRPYFLWGNRDIDIRIFERDQKFRSRLKISIEIKFFWSLGPLGLSWFWGPGCCSAPAYTFVSSPRLAFCFMGPWTFAWICCPQLPYHPCKNRTHSTCFCSTGGHTPSSGTEMGGAQKKKPILGSA